AFDADGLHADEHPAGEHFRIGNVFVFQNARRTVFVIDSGFHDRFLIVVSIWRAPHSAAWRKAVRIRNTAHRASCATRPLRLAAQTGRTMPALRSPTAKARRLAGF